ncbi:cadherin EGF LAG seven-pass G-type receptor 2-like [Xiphophorus hellerii]|uniref:cadherin EGF LAG seven-pass G-type receptor 2-like n=1 Tax=Xiphophorus hellerii TaxID=8084 RepID=UPI0013B45B89|nr:cadherin EGF LAG seven-pass G-type receptor 2-like [Xiphophorus hellerii]
MDGAALRRTCICLIVSVWIHVVTGRAIGSSNINCGSASTTVYLGAVNEGYTGDVELVSAIPVDTIVTLEPDLYPEHLQFVELSFTPGETTATVRTKKPLDADVLTTTDRVLYYTLVCDNNSRNFRRLIISDINDNSPVFEKKFYSQNISESHALNTEVLQVTAVDADITPEFSLLIYTYSPETADFSLANSGAFTLMRPLNYNIVPKYNFIVTAMDGGGNSDTTSVEIIVEDVDNLNPFFSHSLYQAVIPENQDGVLSEIKPEPIKAQDGDTGINMTITYSISSVSPAEYQPNFNIDSNTGALSVVTSFDREEMDSSEISVNIQAAQTDDPLKTADAVVSVTVEDVNDNAPEFDQSSYNVSLLVNSLANLDKNITVIRVSITDDDNDNKPEFSSSSYETSTEVKDAAKGKVVLTLRATDKDIGNNSLITYSFSEGHSPHLALDSETGEVTLTSDLADVTEDTTLVLTAEATDHGKPPLSATALVVVNIRITSSEGVAFLNSSYNFSLKENENSGVTVGQVHASAGSDLYEVSYGLRTHEDLFSIDSSGTIFSTKELDKEEQEWYILDVEAVDNRTPPTSAVALVRIQVEDVNEPPEFSSDDYKASVFSIAPYKTPVIQVKASDPDVGDNSRLVYSLPAGNSSFDVESASGQLYVVSAADLGGKTVTMEVKATDPHGLSATTTVKVVVHGSSDVTTISLNKPADIVEDNIPELEEALGKALGWTVNIIQVQNSGGGESQTLRASVKTLVSFVAFDGDEVVKPQEVAKKLQREFEKVRAELAKVLGDDVRFEVETGKDPPGFSSGQTAGVVVGVLLGLTVMGLTVYVFKRKIIPNRRRRNSKETWADVGVIFEMFKLNISSIQPFKQKANHLFVLQL